MCIRDRFKDGCKPSIEQIKQDWAAFRGPAQELDLPSAPKQFLHYFEESDRPQTKLDRNLEHGMAISLGLSLIHIFKALNSTPVPAALILEKNMDKLKIW